MNHVGAFSELSSHYPPSVTTFQLEYAKKKWGDVSVILREEVNARKVAAADATAAFDALEAEDEDSPRVIAAVAAVRVTAAAAAEAAAEVDGLAGALDAAVGVDAPGVAPRTEGAAPLALALLEIPSAPALLRRLRRKSQRPARFCSSSSEEEEEEEVEDSENEDSDDSSGAEEVEEEEEEPMGTQAAATETIPPLPQPQLQVRREKEVAVVAPVIMVRKSEATALLHPQRREQLVAHRLCSAEAARRMTTKECHAMLVAGLKLKSAKELHVPPTATEKASVNLSKGIGTNNRVSFVWCPEEMGAEGGWALRNPGGVRAKVVRMIRDQLLGGNLMHTDDAVVAVAMARSSYFAGLWSLIEVEIGSATRAMSQWTRGNIEPYFRLFPVLAQLVGRVHKPKVARAMLYKLERLLLYNEKHKDVLSFFAENCLTLRETAIENWHSILTHYVNRHVPHVSHSHYDKASCSAQQVRGLREELNEHLLNRKPALPERLGLLQQMETKEYDATNARVEEFLLKPFR
jgi:hypothetical protein